MELVSVLRRLFALVCSPSQTGIPYDFHLWYSQKQMRSGKGTIRMSIKLRQPMIVEIPFDDDRMEQIMYSLSIAGFMPRIGCDPIAPWSAALDAFHRRTGTYPTYIALTDAVHDSMTNGLSVQLCGEYELSVVRSAVAGDMQEVTADQLEGLLRAWGC